MELVQLRDSIVPKLLKKVDKQGYLRSKARIARVGIQYYEQYGNVMRTEKTLVDSAASFNNQILTYEHPAGKADSANSKDLAIGFITNVSLRGKWLVGDVVVTDGDAVKSILDGVATEFSCGYTAKLEKVNGDYLGEPYDYEVYDVAGNHVSLVSEARAGNQATFIDSSKQTLSPREGTTMENPQDTTGLQEVLQTIMTRLDAIEAKLNQEVETDSTLAGSNGTMHDAKDEAVEENIVDAKDEKIAELEAKVDILTDSLEKTKETEPTVIYDGAEIAARVEVWSFVKPLLKDSVDIDYGMNVSDVRKLYLAEKLPQLATKIKDGSSAYIKGLWDGIVGALPAKEPELVSSPVTVEANDSLDIKDAVDVLSQEPSAKSTQDAAREAYIARLAANRG
jgi:hypothetical protein